jgi:hypothetical protein
VRRREGRKRDRSEKGEEERERGVLQHLNLHSLLDSSKYGRKRENRE